MYWVYQTDLWKSASNKTCIEFVGGLDEKKKH